MRGKRLAERRQKNIEITKLDRANRCVVCKRAPAPLTSSVNWDVKFCSHTCWLEYVEDFTPAGKTTDLKKKISRA